MPDIIDRRTVERDLREVRNHEWDVQTGRVGSFGEVVVSSRDYGDLVGLTVRLGQVASGVLAIQDQLTEVSEGTPLAGAPAFIEQLQSEIDATAEQIEEEGEAKRQADQEKDEARQALDSLKERVEAAVRARDEYVTDVGELVRDLGSLWEQLQEQLDRMRFLSGRPVWAGLIESIAEKVEDLKSKTDEDDVKDILIGSDEIISPKEV